jgi:hypothetical protein
MRYGLLPVGLEAGRFHPKITLLAGPSVADPSRQVCWLCVGSGNLSLSGWALQREVAGVTALTRQHGESLQPLVRWLIEQARSQVSLAAGASARAEGSVLEVLQQVQAVLTDPLSLSPHRASTPTLHLAWPPELERAAQPVPPLVAAVTGGEPWERAVVVSPYWAGVDELVEQLGVQACTLVPAPTAEGRLLRPAGVAVNRHLYGYFMDDATRASHAKAVLLSRAGEHVLCVGSANFTMAAWSHGEGRLANVEAVLRYRVRGESPWEAIFAPLIDPEEAQLDEEPDAEGAPALPPFDAEAACDWQARKLIVRIRLHERAALENVSLAIGEMQARVDVKSLAPQLFVFDAKSLRMIKRFDVWYRHPNKAQASFVGLVLQLNAPEDVLGYRPRPRLSSLIQVLRSLNPELPPQTQRKWTRGAGGSDETDGLEDESTAMSSDLFGYFQATFHMRRYFQKLEALDPFDPISPIGPFVLYRAVEVQQCDTDEAVIARYVQLCELLATVEALPTPGASAAAKADLRVSLLEDIKAPEGRVRQLLASSEPFATMFPHSHGEPRSDMLIEWFRREVRLGHD